MSIFRLVILSVLVSASAWAIATSQPAGADFSASATMTLLPDLTPLQPLPRGEAVLAHLTHRLTPDMVTNFDLFLYVSKSDRGPLAQRMYVFEKSKPDGLKLAYEWAASTGREKAEVNARGRRVLTATPIGYYQLDPTRMYPRYRSASWDQDMPNTMFLDWERAGAQTGLAIHAATPPDVAKLGSRASAGCVHLSPDHAATLYELIRTNYRGPVPRFAYNGETHTRSNRGDFMRDSGGALKMSDGYRVLVVLEDYGGEDAALL
jgi:hypothetical protein